MEKGVLDGWTIEDVATEMRRQTYRDGWLPGYVLNMVKDWVAEAGTLPRGGGGDYSTSTSSHTVVTPRRG